MYNITATKGVIWDSQSVWACSAPFTFKTVPIDTPK